MPSNLTPFIKDLIRLRRHLDQAITSFSYFFLGSDQGTSPSSPPPIRLKLVAVPLRTRDKTTKAPSAPTTSTAAYGKTPSIKPDSFQGLSTWEAAEKFLQLRGKPVLTGEMAVALTAHGFETESENFRRALYKALKKKPGIFTRPEKGLWGLKVWKTK